MSEDNTETVTPESVAVVVRMKHARACGYCSQGVRTFCTRHGLSYPDFLANGISSDSLAALDDGMANKMIEAARG